MAKCLSDLLQNADTLINGRVNAEKVASAHETDDVFKLAELVRRGPSVNQEKTATVLEDDFSFQEKIAHSMAISDALSLLPTIEKIAQFEKKARDAGYTEEQVQRYIEANNERFGLAPL